VHFFEHIILLSHGYCRPGLIKFLADSDLKNVFTAIISIQQGNYENFITSANDFKFIDQDPSQNLEKIIQVMMLVKGESTFCKTNEMSGVKNCYDKLFTQMCGKNRLHKPTRVLHTMCLTRNVKLISLIKRVAVASSTEKNSWAKNSLKSDINRLLTEVFYMDANSISWLSVL